jgi:glycosyltransferase involved in cell wall biosynthesis
VSDPRVTLGIAAYNGERFLAEAIESCLAQDHPDFELLIVDDASTDSTPEVIARYAADPRVRVVTHERNRGIAAAYDAIWQHGRGELIARLGHDDVAVPDRLSRQVAVFDAHPDTGVVHGDAVTIDASGRVVGEWRSTELGPGVLMQTLLRRHNYLVDPTTMIHRRVYEQVGGYDPAYPMCNDFDLWLRAAPRFRFRHCGGGPLIRYRRHGTNFSDESARAREIEEVERAIEAAIARESTAVVAPEARTPEQALVLLADALERRALPLPGLAGRLRERGLAGRRRIVMTSFGYNDSGGGTIVPRQISKELAARGWDVTVFHAAVGTVEPPEPYQVREWWEDGVRLVGVFNRPHGLLDLGNPDREVDDPPITRAFADMLDRVRPDVVHFHNLHNLGAALIDEAAVRGIRSLFTTHNYWLACPRGYLFTDRLALCHGPGDRGGDCAACVGSMDADAYRRRLSEIRGRFGRGVDVCLAVSEAMRATLAGAGYPADMIDVVPQAMPEDEAIWDALGRDRRPGRLGPELTVGFFGSALPQKGPSLLVDAAQRTEARIRVRIHGEVPEAFAADLRARDARGVVEICGAFGHDDLPALLAGVDVAVIPSLWWDCAPLMVSECLAGRVPVLAARMGGIPDFVADERDGLLFDGRDPADLARRLDRLAQEPGLLERLQAGVSAPRSFAGHVDELEAYYRGERPRRDHTGNAPTTVRWRGDHGSAQSLAGINRNVCDRLERDPGIGLQRTSRTGAGSASTLPLPAQVEVRHQFPPDLRPAAGGRLAVIQPWEFGAVPVEWVEGINRNVDELWVPSAYVRDGYVAGGVDPGRVAVVPNGVDLDVFTPDGPRMPLDAPGLRFLFVGGLIERKGPDLLLAAFLDAFEGRDDVSLVIKDFGADNVYPGTDRSKLLEYAGSGALPRVVYLHRDMDERELAALYRACDVLVQPYRGEGFAMPVLEAMASGLPVVVTAGGPTDEFCPDAACWRIRSERRMRREERLDRWVTAGRPWMLEPDLPHLRELLAAAAADADGRAARGRAGRAAAAACSWDAVAEAYRGRIAALAARPPRHGDAGGGPLELEPARLRLLATPAWHGRDRLGELLAAWVTGVAADSGACLFLLADPRTSPGEEECTDLVLAAAADAGVSLDRAADIVILSHALAGGDEPRLHAAVDGYVPLHDACTGHARWARAAGRPVLAPDAAALAAWAAAEPALRSAA